MVFEKLNTEFNEEAFFNSIKEKMAKYGQSAENGTFKFKYKSRFTERKSDKTTKT